MTRLPALGPRGEGWVLAQGILLVLVAAAGWSLGPDWSGPLRLVGIVVGVAMIVGGALLGFRAVRELGIYLKSVREEAWLEQRFPDYAAYRARTGRFIPWISRSGR